MRLIGTLNKGITFLLCVTDIYSKFAWVIPVKNKKKRITITNAFQKILDKSNRQPNKVWVDKGNKFYNRSMKSWLEKNEIEIYSTHNEKKCVVAERFIKTSNNKIYKYRTSISKNVYTYKLDDIVNKYNNAQHSAIKMNALDVEPSTYIECDKKINYQNPKLKTGDAVIISKY